MKKARFLLPVMAALVAVVASLAFTAPKKDVKPATQGTTYIWVYYDCTAPTDEILATDFNYTFSDGEAALACPNPDSDRLCAVKYVLDEDVIFDGDEVVDVSNATIAPLPNTINCN